MPDVTDADLVYDGRARKRPPGAGTDVQEIYMLLAAHPGGMTLDEIHAAMRDGWMYTDAYRAYEKRLARNRKVLNQKASGRALQYGTPEFKRRAQRWYIASKLTRNMQSRGSARRDGDRWFAANPPNVAEVTDRLRLVKLDVAAKRTHDESDVRQHVRREEAKAALLALLNDRRIKGKTRDGIQLAYDVLSGR